MIGAAEWIIIGKHWHGCVSGNSQGIKHSRKKKIIIDY
jgi:hypothetical protein